MKRLIKKNNLDPNSLKFPVGQIGPRIRIVRLNKNMTIDELSSQSNISPPDLYKIETGSYNNGKNISMKMLGRILLALEINIADLLKVDINDDNNQILQQPQQYFPANEVGPKIRIVRLNKGITGIELSNRAEIDDGDLSKIENGIYNNGRISIKVLERIVKVLGITIDELLQIDHTNPTLQPYFSVKEIGSKIRAAREKKNISLVKLENLIGIDDADISRIENGTYNNGGNIGRRLLERILQGLNLSIEDLLNNF